MRRFIPMLALLSIGCARQHYAASLPTPVSRPAVALPPTAPAPPRASTGMWSSDVVTYILGRSLLIPVAGVTSQRLHDAFDEGRDGARTHRAIDILAPRGTPVLAADSGRILRISENALGGNTIYASDPLGRVVYYYAHLDAYQSGLLQGAAVARGDTVGFVGTTGNAPKDTPHLHFQIMRMPADGKYWDGDAINPYPLFLLMHDPVQP